jgi:hypothetical protein
MHLCSYPSLSLALSLDDNEDVINKCKELLNKKEPEKNKIEKIKRQRDRKEHLK